MSVEHDEQLYAQREALGDTIVYLILRLSDMGKINWDFSHFDDSAYGQMAVVQIAMKECGVVTIACYDWQDTGIEMEISTKEKKKDKITGEERDVWLNYQKEIVGSFRGEKVKLLRRFLKKLAFEDPTLNEIRRQEKARQEEFAEVERKRDKERIEKLNEIVQSLPKG